MKVECQSVTRSIKDIVNRIEKNEIILPAIQRKYVWREEQVEKLMDSILRGYPFGTFLFWKVNIHAIKNNNYSMYRFIQDYHEKDTFENEEMKSYDSSIPEVLSVLDGQQRLTSLFIALKGSLSLKKKRLAKKNPNAYPKKELYFNLLSEGEKAQKSDDEDDIIYEFKFLTDEEVKESEKKKEKLWFNVKEILAFEEPSDMYNEHQGLKINGDDSWKKDGTISYNLVRLHEALVKEKKISYFEISSDSIDDVLDIFVRVNSGGTVLSKTDLLFSTIVSHWIEARKTVNDFIRKIEGEKYKIDIDFVMRSCLYILDMPTVLKVETFGRENVNKIRDNWEKVADAIEELITFLDRTGFNGDNITSTNALLPILYYRYKNGKGSLRGSNLNEFRKYFVIAQLKQVFGAASQDALRVYRDRFKDYTDKFTLKSIEDIKVVAGNNLRCTKSDIEDWMSEFHKGKYTFMILTLIEPDLDFGYLNYEQDHLHLDKYFKEKKLKSGENFEKRNGLSENEAEDWIEKSDTVPNLHFLTSKENAMRKDMPLGKWLSEGGVDGKGGKGKDDDLPVGVGFSFDEFDKFYDERKKLLVDKLMKILDIPE